MWEYRRTELSYKLNDELVSELNQNGLDGWELIIYEEIPPKVFGGVRTSKMVFKRKTPINQEKIVL